MFRACLISCLLLVSKVKAQITSNDSLNNFVSNWLKVPYKLGGTNMSGIDCSKLTQKVYSEVFNVELPSVSWKQWSATERISKDSLKTGDLVFFRSRYSPSGWHVGLYLIDDFFFHASNKKQGVKISSLSESYYQKNYKGAGRKKI